MKKVKIKYFSDDYPRLKKLPQGDFIDLRVDNLVDMQNVSEGELEVIRIGFSEDGILQYKKGDVLLLGLGVAMELPTNHEAYLVPRSSTFKNTGFLLTNGVGIVDEIYAGNQDQWMAMVYCTRDGAINRYDRLFQFRIQEKMPKIEFQEVEYLDNDDRGGFGSTGIE